MTVVRWTFTDPVTSASYEFEINPKEGGTPTQEKTMAYANTAAPNGRVLAFEGRQKQQEGQFTGLVLSQDQYDAMHEWFDKRYQIYMTDDLNRTYTIYITRLEEKRIRSATKPWKHEYTVNYFIMDWD
jgi:hypothetical protein